MIALIAAMSKNYCIGRQGVIPWKIKGEQKRFRELTIGRTVVMGRRSFEEIGRPLPDRRTILVSTTKKWESGNCITVGSFQEAMAAADGEDLYIAGGAMLYERALPLADKLYLTVIDLNMEGDTFFPVFDKSLFHITFEEYHKGDIPYTCYTWERKT